MPLTQQHRKQITALYCIMFCALLVYKLANGFLLFQLKPFLYSTRLDIFTFLIMKTGLHRWLVGNPAGYVAFDVAFYSMPLLYWIVSQKNLRVASAVAVLMLLVNFIYIQCYTLFPVGSIESFSAWLLFPFLFMTVELKSFYFVLQALRYFLLYFFVSAAVWKIVQGGLFNIGEMSGVLLLHHKEYLATSPDGWYTALIYHLVNHPYASYVLYVLAALAELFFIVGFFTKRFDKWLFIIFLLFLISDHFIMRIPYWEISPFLLTLIYARYKEPVT